MKPVIIFRHLECEGPGYLAEFLDNRKIPFSVIRIDSNEPVPQSIKDCSGLVFMGGPMSVNDDLPWIRQELNLIRKAADAQLPVLGHCLGGQLICKALDGEVRPNGLKEIGWHAVNRIDSPSADKWLGAMPPALDVFHWHGETFSIPNGAENILTSKYCEHQAFSLDNILAMQCHIEMTSEMVETWAVEYADEISQPSESVQSQSQMTANLEQRIARLRLAADSIYREWTDRLK